MFHKSAVMALTGAQNMKISPPKLMQAMELRSDVAPVFLTVIFRRPTVLTENPAIAAGLAGASIRLIIIVVVVEGSACQQAPGLSTTIRFLARSTRRHAGKRPWPLELAILHHSP